MVGSRSGEVPRASSRWWRATGRGVTAAVVTGLVSAVVTRMLMRVVEVATNGTPQFGWGGMVMIFLFYVLCLLPGCVALALARSARVRRIGWVVFGAGTLLLTYTAVSIGVQETNDRVAMSAGQWLLLVVAVLAMVVVYAAQVVGAARLALGGLPLLMRPASLVRVRGVGG
jgi:hypothetical protein